MRHAVTTAPAEVWETISVQLHPDDAHNEINNHRLANRLRLALEKWFADLVPPEILLSWADCHPGDGAALIAQLANVSGNPMNALARGLLIRFHDDPRIGGILAARFTTGSIMGPFSLWLEGKLALAEAWATEPSPSVRRWAVKSVAELRTSSAAAKLTEAEGGL